MGRLIALIVLLIACSSTSIHHDRFDVLEEQDLLLKFVIAVLAIMVEHLIEQFLSLGPVGIFD